MPAILRAEIIQLLVYIAFGIFVAVSRFKKPLYFALGFVLATGIPSVLLGYGFKGMHAAMAVGNSDYEKFRGLPVASGIWGLIHLILAFIIYLKIKDDFKLGLNLETALLAAGFCLIYIPVSILQGKIG